MRPSSVASLQLGSTSAAVVVSAAVVAVLPAEASSPSSPPQDVRAPASDRAIAKVVRERVLMRAADQAAGPASKIILPPGAIAFQAVASTPLSAGGSGLAFSNPVVVSY